MNSFDYVFAFMGTALVVLVWGYSLWFLASWRAARNTALVFVACMAFFDAGKEIEASVRSRLATVKPAKVDAPPKPDMDRAYSSASSPSDSGSDASSASGPSHSGPRRSDASIKTGVVAEVMREVEALRVKRAREAEELRVKNKQEAEQLREKNAEVRPPSAGVDMISFFIWTSYFWSATTCARPSTASFSCISSKRS